MPTQDYISIYKGASFDHLAFLSKVSDGSPVDLTGATITSELRQSSGGKLVASFTVDVLNPTTGELRLSLTAEDTNAILASRPVFDILVEWPDGTTLRTATVKCNLEHGVTEL